MIKEIATGIILTTISNVISPNQTRANADILNEPNNIQVINENQDESTAYRVKTFSNNFDLTYATVQAKGFHRVYIDEANEIQSIKTIYYFKCIWTNGTENDFTFTDLTINLRGFRNPNVDYQLYYEEYNMQYTTQSTINNIDVFLNSNNYNFSMLENAYNSGIWQNFEDMSDIDVETTNASLKTRNQYKYYRWELIWTNDYGENIYNTEKIINSILNYYTACTLVYNWTIDIEFKGEVVDIPGLLFTMLGMPFAWISTAFNVTLFSGTPYAINISRLFFEIVCTLLLIIVLRKLIK